MKKGKKLYEGKAKIIYATNDKNLVIQYFKYDATFSRLGRYFFLRVVISYIPPFARFAIKSPSGGYLVKIFFSIIF